MKARTAFTIIAILCINLLLTGVAAADTAAPLNPLDRWRDPAPLRLPVDRSTPTNDVVSPDAPTSDETLSFTTIAAGSGHTCALTAGGAVKCWGYNGEGELGDGTTTYRSTPVDVSGLSSGVTALTTGGYPTCALMDATHGGGVKCWGDNRSGQLGDGTTTSRSTPVDVSGLSSGVFALAAGWSHICAVTANGGSKCWGADHSGQLGVGRILRRLIPVDVVETAPPSLTINYPDGQPGSFFTITGWNYPPDVQATLSINSQVITRLLGVKPTGSFIFFLNTAGAATGSYEVTVSVNPSATTSFTLADGAPLRPQEGGGRTVTFFQTDRFLYLPSVQK